MSSVYNQLRHDLMATRKAKDRLSVELLQSVIARIDNATAIVDPKTLLVKPSHDVAGATGGLGSSELERRRLSEDEILELMQDEIKELEHAIEVMSDAGQHHFVSELESKIALVRTYLP